MTDAESSPEKLARLIKEAFPLAKEIATGTPIDRERARGAGGVTLPFFYYYLHRVIYDARAAPDESEREMLGPAYHGRVISWSPKQGLGRIQCEDGEEAYFLIFPLRLFGWNKPLPAGTFVTFNQKISSGNRRQVLRFLAIGLDTDPHA